MRIRTFCKFVEVSELESMVLHDSTVVIDGQNYFYNSYQESQLPFKLGCESHRYANYLREHLAMFKKANVKCYFIFKGGHENMAKRLAKNKGEIVSPVFMKNIYMEVLKEMDFEYVTCEYESKRDIIELAQTLDCPVISYDVEFCFTGLRYIPRNELKFNERDNTITCRYFSLDKFMRKYTLTAEKLALFIVLTDENIFPENFFQEFFKRIRAPLGYFKRNLSLLYWVSKNNRNTTIKMVSQFVNAEDEKKFVEEVDKAQLLIRRREKGGLSAACLLNPAAATVAPGDPNWFAKGVASNNIPINYVNLYRSKHFFGSMDVELVDPMVSSLEIVKYAYDLLTDFQNDGFTLVYDTLSGQESMVVSELYSIRKPEYEASVCVFENGWDSVREFALFEHFLKETLQLASLQPLKKLPEGARLLVVALVYFSRKKSVDTSTEATCVLLSYITLSLVLQKCGKNLPKFPFQSKPILDSTTDESTVTDEDCNIAAAVLAEYLAVPETAEQEAVDDDQVLYQLKEFQICLRQLNDLNLLCGAPLPPTVYSRVYSAALVARLRVAAGSGDSQPFFDKLLAPAPTVYAFLNGLIEAYQAM
ncbi:uncharacterized protein [Choristoneura fumiferana]|uniref:uncharacterized protein n=1 Tax=Choristoneura fumiferana TaxID=7141 RepID=UPI003D15C3A3